MNAAARAEAAWGEMPDWIVALADACDRRTQAAVAKMIGYSTTVVSQILTRKYTGSLGAVEKAVRGALMHLTVECPVMGEIPTSTCLTNQRQKFSAANRMAVKLHSTCPTCKHSRQGDKNAQ